MEQSAYMQRMQKNTNSLLAQEKYLNDCVSTLDNTEIIAIDTLETLKGQGDQLNKLIEKTDDLSENLSISNRIIRSMEWSKIKNTLLVLLIIIILLIIIGFIVMMFLYSIYRDMR
ncbi:hypothetical protein Catovirus_1_907 [Catovirus CTV1]|uniref:t-SNARE coiled-coil homology domain-containing protein n=1 Tax=Catovirus CTV1 TaxID=1977631 RepID=A0A1V0SAW4_9VIRU|nr:hypothetical protein Catovirus_1_907 [Catovirus CTV1]